jgi:hypothetical protein
MESLEKAVTELTPQVVVAEGVIRARAAFLRDFAALLADRKMSGKYVCYHNEVRVAVSDDYLTLVREVAVRNIPENASLIVHVTRASERDERAIAEEAELP